MTLETKLHILLITTILGVGLYMFLLYKEIKMFERELADLRIKVQGVASQLPPASGSIIDIVDAKSVCQMSVPQRASMSDALSAIAPQIAVIADNYDEPSDDMSVTSNEIKEILTNIQDIQDDVSSFEPIHPTPTCHAPPAPAPPTPAPVALPKKAASSNTPPLDLENWHTMTDAQVSALKYDDLRNIIRKRGVNIKGTKQDLLNMVLSIKSELIRA